MHMNMNVRLQMDGLREGNVCGRSRCAGLQFMSGKDPLIHLESVSAIMRA